MTTLSPIIQLLYRSPLQGHPVLIRQLMDFLQAVILPPTLHMQLPHPLRGCFEHGLHRMNAINPIH
jgi:hypothetical protein